jgi:flagellar basal-body rod protein FlgC
MSTLSGAITAGATALNAERTRIEVAVSNMANAESTRSADGGPYRRRDVMLAADSGQTFDAALGSASGEAGAVGVKVTGIVQDQSAFRRRYEPSHPDADADGFVSLPNVDPSQEMVDMLGAARAYQANIAAISMIRDLVAKSLELGR